MTAHDEEKLRLRRQLAKRGLVQPPTEAELRLYRNVELPTRPNDDEYAEEDDNRWYESEASVQEEIAWAILESDYPFQV